MKALSFLQSIPDKLGISKTLEMISKVYKKEGQIEQAILFANKSLLVADSNNIVNQQQVILPLLAKYYSEIQHTDKSYKYLQRYVDLKESNVNKNSKQIQVEYEMQMRQQEGRLAEEKQKKQRTLTYFSIGGLVLFGLLSGVIFFKNRDLKESYKNLYNKHIALSKKEEELIEIKKLTKIRPQMDEGLYPGLFVELSDLMVVERIFLNKNLTLDDLAKRLNTNRTYLSQVINDTFNTNFNNYINEYRIKEAQKLFLQSASKLLTIEAIAQNVGFNSKAPFNIAFKKFTGLTPTDFMRMQES